MKTNNSFTKEDWKLDRRAAHISPRVAAYLGSIGGLTNGSGTAHQWKSLERDPVRAIHFIRFRLESLEDRIQADCTRRCLKGVLQLLENRPRAAERLLRTAYFRDLILQSFLEIQEFIARRHGDCDRAVRIAKLRDFWNSVDKGVLASKKTGREALTLLRRLHMYEMLSPARTLKQRAKDEAELSRPLLDAAKNAEGDFELALAKAKQLRAKRRPARITEEGDLRADLAFFGVLGQFRGETFPDNDTLREAFAPVLHATLVAAVKRGEKDDAARQRARNIKRNWRKLLDESKVTPRTPKKAGRPRKVGTS